jgi:hypothetical protein
LQSLISVKRHKNEETGTVLGGEKGEGKEEMGKEEEKKREK